MTCARRPIGVPRNGGVAVGIGGAPTGGGPAIWRPPKPSPSGGPDLGQEWRRTRELYAAESFRCRSAGLGQDRRRRGCYDRRGRPALANTAHVLITADRVGRVQHSDLVQRFRPLQLGAGQIDAAVAHWADEHVLTLVGDDRDEEERQPASDSDEIEPVRVTAVLAPLVQDRSRVVERAPPPTENNHRCLPFPSCEAPRTTCGRRCSLAAPYRGDPDPSPVVGSWLQCWRTCVA